MRKKLHSYLGFAKRSGNLLSGYNTCIHAMTKNKVRLLILAEDLAENTLKKITKEAEKQKVAYRMYSKGEVLSQITGSSGRGIFGITDENFAKVIERELEEMKSQEKEVFE